MFFFAKKTLKKLHVIVAPYLGSPVEYRFEPRHGVGVLWENTQHTLSFPTEKKTQEKYFHLVQKDDGVPAVSLNQLYVSPAFKKKLKFWIFYFYCAFSKPSVSMSGCRFMVYSVGFSSLPSEARMAFFTILSVSR